jgi:hypothetical protein
LKTTHREFYLEHKVPPASYNATFFSHCKVENEIKLRLLEALKTFSKSKMSRVIPRSDG